MCLGDVVGVGLKTGCDGGSGCGKCRGVSGEREGRVRENVGSFKWLSCVEQKQL